MAQKKKKKVKIHSEGLSPWLPHDSIYEEGPMDTSEHLLLRRTCPQQLAGRNRTDPKPQPRISNILGRADLHGALELLLAVILEVHQPGLAEDEPAPLPVPPGQCGGAAALLVQPALLEGFLLGTEPQEGFVLEDTPAAFPGVHEATCAPRIGFGGVEKSLSNGMLRSEGLGVQPILNLAPSDPPSVTMLYCWLVPEKL